MRTFRRRNPEARRRAAFATWPPIALLLAATGPPVEASGGHHAVDGASLLEPGQCQVETWYERARANASRLWHFGSACRIGAVELDLGFERSRAAGEPRVHALTPQLKWAAGLAESLTVAVAWSATWQDERPRFAGHSLVVPLTWQPTGTLAVHANLGRDFRAGGPDATIAGLAIEWSATRGWSFVAEGYRDGDGRLWRAAARYQLADTGVSFDLGYARPSGGAAAWWTAGVNWAFDR